MTTTTIDFSHPEKLAIVQTLESLIIVDGKVNPNELNAMSKLMNRIDFDSNFILQARNIPASEGHLILKKMIPEKKKFLTKILNEVANSDGHFHEKEMALILDICKATDL